MPKKPPKAPITPVGASINDTCKRHGVSRSTVYNDLDAGRYTARKKGAKTIVDVASADAYYLALPRKQPSSVNPAARALAARKANPPKRGKRGSTPPGA